jgi:hypothetical protein
MRTPVSPFEGEVDMRTSLGALAALLLLFAAVQYDDADGPFWATVYGAAALWAAIGALRPRWLERRAVQVLLAASLLAVLGGIVAYWPQAEAWWRLDVWWHDEAAREGIGFMIVGACLVLVAAAARRGGLARG